MAKTESKPIVYHKNHIPADIKGDYTYTYNWNDVTDPAALKIRAKELTDAGKTVEAAQIAAIVETSTEAKK